MRGFTKAIVAGNLTRDPEVRTTSNGANVCSFTIAANRVYRDNSGEQKEAVSFIDCSAWSGLGDMIGQYAKKGTGVLVSGRLDQHSWDDKATGQRRSRVEVVVEDFIFAGGRDSGGGASSSGDPDTAPNSPSVLEDIPDNVRDGEISLSDMPF